MLALSACATSGGEERVSPDDAPATAAVDKLGEIAMCESTYDNVVAALGQPYRDGVAHKLRVVSWKISPGVEREPTSAVIAFKDNVAVDICYDLPGMVACELADHCAKEGS
jgi:hypothetical protein